MKKWSHIQMPLLLMLFSLVGFLLISVTASSYQAIIRRGEASFESGICLSYVANKLRQKDGLDSVSIEEKEGHEVLVIQEEQGEATYETWIYAYQNKLYEAYVPKGTKIELESGFELLEIKSLYFEKLEEDMLHVGLVTKSGKRDDLTIRLRCI